MPALEAFARIAQAVVVWLEADASGRAASLPTLLAAIRLDAAELQRQAEACGVLAAATPAAATALRAALGDACLARGCAAGSAGVRLPSPRQSRPTGLLAAGGHDVGWHSQRCVRGGAQRGCAKPSID